MFQLQLTIPAELLLILEGHHAEWVPVAKRRASTKFLRRVKREEALTIVEGRDVAGSELLDRGLSSEAVLNQHARPWRSLPAFRCLALWSASAGARRDPDLPAPVSGPEISGLLLRRAVFKFFTRLVGFRL